MTGRRARAWLRARFPSISTRLAVLAGGTATGVAVGGPAPLPLLAVGATSLALEEGRSALLEHWHKRAVRTLEPSIERLGDERFNELMAQPRPAALTLRAMRAAAVITIEEHIDVLARVLRDGLTGDLPEPDIQHLIGVLTELTPEAVAVLHALTLEPVSTDTSATKRTTHLDRVLAEQIGMPLGVARHALARLELHGAAARTAGGSNGEDGFDIQPLGQRLLDYLAGDDPP